jgi:hypothetical protein
VRPYVVSHLNAKLQNWQWAGIYFFQEKSRNVHRIAGLLIKCNSFAESPNLVQQTGPYSPSLLISCSVTVIEITRQVEAARGVIAEFVPKRTLSSIEERGAGISQRPKPILERFGRPDVVAIKTDVFPAERSDVGEQCVGQNFALDAKLGDGVGEIDGVPEGDGGDREVETRGPIALVFEGAVPDLAMTMEKQGTG